LKHCSQGAGGLAQQGLVAERRQAVHQLLHAGCHSAKYLRYDRMAQDLEDRSRSWWPEYMMFTTDKVGDAMDSHTSIPRNRPSGSAMRRLT
jgi:hypothetical protein